jgi:hypothetical protein
MARRKGGRKGKRGGKAHITSTMETPFGKGMHKRKGKRGGRRR